MVERPPRPPFVPEPSTGSALTEAERIELEREAQTLRHQLMAIEVKLRRSAKSWVIRDVKIGNVMVPATPPTAADRARLEDAAREHVPRISRTLIGGPGNHQRIDGCFCDDARVRDAESWAVHIGALGAASFIIALLALEDAASDAIDYPGDDTTRSLNGMLRTIGSVYRANGPLASDVGSSARSRAKIDP